MSAFYNMFFGFIPTEIKTLILGLISVAFIVAIIKFLKP